MQMSAIRHNKGVRITLKSNAGKFLDVLARIHKGRIHKDPRSQIDRTVQLGKLPRKKGSAGRLSQCMIVKLEIALITTRKKGTVKAITKVMTIIAFAVGLAAIPDTLAQRNYHSKTVEPVRDYNPTTVETVSGTVLSIEKTTPQNKQGYWVDLMLQTGNGTIAVELGPAWYVDRQTPRIDVNDMIMVTGSRMTIGGKSIVIAAEVRKQNEILKLRDANGVSVWPRVNQAQQQANAH